MARAGPRGDRAPDADGHDPGYLRLAEPISYVSTTVTKMLETAVPIGSPPADLTDTDVLAVLNQHTVKDAQSALSAARRQRIAEYVGLGDRRPRPAGRSQRAWASPHKP